MKTRFLLVVSAAAALMFVACSKNGISLLPPHVENNDNPILFSTYIPQTPDVKGVETDGDYISKGTLATGFGVNAAYTGTTSFSSGSAEDVPDFMYNQQVKYSGTEWTYSPVKYWPIAGDKVSFFAWAPYGGAGINLLENTAAASQLQFQIQDNPKNTVDFVADAKIDASRSNPVEGIDFELKHELTRVDLKVFASEDLGATSIVITDVKLKGSKIYKSATYNFAETNEGTGTWSNPVSLAADEKYDLNGMINWRSNIIIGDYKPEKGFIFNGTETEPQRLFEETHRLYLIPAIPSGTTANADIAIEFTYDIVTADTAVPGRASVLPVTSQVVELKPVTLEQGKSYVFNFKFKMDNIAFSATVIGWDEVPESEVTIPQS